MEDAGIVELYFARSEEAIRETEGKYGPFLKKLAYNILRSRRDVEEVVNDTYLGAWNAIPPTRPQCLKHFLSRIARNLSLDRLDYLTAGKRRGLLEELSECIPAPGPTVEEAWEAKEVGESLNRFLAGLDEEAREVFVGRYYYACALEELAGRTGLSRRRIKYLLGKTRKALRIHLEREGVRL